MSDEAEVDPRMPKPPPQAKVPEEAVDLQDAAGQAGAVQPGAGQAGAGQAGAGPEGERVSDRPTTRSLVPLPEGYPGASRRSSVPPGRLSAPPLRNSDSPRPRLNSTPGLAAARDPSASEHAEPVNPPATTAPKAESKAVVTPMRIIALKTTSTHSDPPPATADASPGAKLPGSDMPTPPDTPAAVASARPSPAPPPMPPAEAGAPVAGPPVAGAPVAASPLLAPAESRVDAPTPPETPALRRELLEHVQAKPPAELARTQESAGVEEVEPDVEVEVIEPPPPPARSPSPPNVEVSAVEAEPEELPDELFQSADSGDNLEAISVDDLTEVEAVSEREPGHRRETSVEAAQSPAVVHPQPPSPPKPPAPPSPGAAAPAASPETEKPAPPPPRATQASRPRRKRLPRTPPRRTSFTGASEDGKRRPWWEELWNDDFLRADALPDEIRLAQEVDFIERSVSVEPGAVVLDLACGAGDHAVELTRRGLSVVGYDLSESQLIRAKDLAEDEKQDVRFMQGDVREMSFEKMFDAVYCWNASFGYFEEEKNLAVLANIFRALKPGGSFLLDVPNRDFVVRQQPMQCWFEGDGAVCMDDMHVDFITSRLNVKRTVMLDDGRNREWHYSLRLYSLHELGKMLHSIGFRVGQISGDVATPNAFLGGYSQRVIILAVKPSEQPSKPGSAT